MTDTKKVAKTAQEIKLSAIKSEIITKQYKDLTNIYNGDQGKLKQFMDGCFTEIARTIKADTTQESVQLAVMDALQLKLSPSSKLGLINFIPYKDKHSGGTRMTLLIGYKGMIELFARYGGQIEYCEMVREKDEFEVVGNGKYIHKIDPRLTNKDRGNPLGIFGVAVVNGNRFEKYMNIDDIKSNNGKGANAFVKAKDSEQWFDKKTLIKQLIKLAPINAEMRDIIEKDNKQEGNMVKQTAVDVTVEEIKKKVDSVKDVKGLEDLWNSLNPDEKKANAKMIKDKKEELTPTKPKAKKEENEPSDEEKENIKNEENNKG